MGAGLTRVLVIEDDPIVRDELCAVVAAVPGFALAGSASGAKDALALFAASPPSLALLDLGLPDGSGLDLIEPARARGHQCIVITVHEDDPTVFRAIERGAAGYLLKAQGPSAVGEALEATRAGEAFVSPRIARRLLTFFRTRGGERAVPDPPRDLPRDDGASLTAREREVIELFSRGLTYAEVAGLFGISINTVRSHVRQSYEKLHVCSKAEAVTALLLRR